MTQIQTPYGLLTFVFERRSYGRGQFYCWAYVLNGAESISMGDPWPASNFKRSALMEPLSWALAGKVLAPANICRECNGVGWHSFKCSQWYETETSCVVAVEPAGYLERAA